MSFTNLIENQEEKSTSPCQDCRYVKVNNLDNIFEIGVVLNQFHWFIAVNYNSMLGGTSVFTWS